MNEGIGEAIKKAEALRGVNAPRLAEAMGVTVVHHVQPVQRG